MKLKFCNNSVDELSARCLCIRCFVNKFSLFSIEWSLKSNFVFIAKFISFQEILSCFIDLLLFINIFISNSLMLLNYITSIFVFERKKLTLKEFRYFRIFFYTNNRMFIARCVVAHAFDFVLMCRRMMPYVEFAILNEILRERAIDCD